MALDDTPLAKTYLELLGVTSEREESVPSPPPPPRPATAYGRKPAAANVSELVQFLDEVARDFENGTISVGEARSAAGASIRDARRAGAFSTAPLLPLFQALAPAQIAPAALDTAYAYFVPELPQETPNNPASLRRLAKALENLGGHGPKAGRKKPHGRPRIYDPEDDRRIAEGWAKKQFKTHTDLATHLGKSVSTIRLALDRHRKRSQEKGN